MWPTLQGPPSTFPCSQNLSLFGERSSEHRKGGSPAPWGGGAQGPSTQWDLRGNSVRTLSPHESQELRDRCLLSSQLWNWSWSTELWRPFGDHESLNLKNSTQQRGWIKGIKRAKTSGKWQKYPLLSDILKMWKLTPYLLGPQLGMFYFLLLTALIYMEWQKRFMDS